MESTRQGPPAASPRDLGVGRRASAVLRLVSRVVESGVPEGLTDADAERRARIVLSFSLVLVVLGLEAVIFFAWALPAERSIWVALALAVGLMLALAVPTVLRRTRSISFGANLVLGGSYLVTATAVLVVGGIRAPVLHWLALAPMLAVLMGARRSAWAWASVAVSTISALVVADAMGVHFPDALGLADLEGGVLWAQRYVDVASWVGILFAVALVYEAQRKRQNRELARKNALLESEVAQRSRAEERNQYLAYYDDLTTLPNRRLFQSQLSRALEQAPSIGRQVAVLFLDLDGFKQVNDTYGHALGDRLLQHVADRLQGSIRVSDVAARIRATDPQVVSRLGGDEFTIMLSGIRDHREAALVAERILSCMEQPYLLGDHEMFLTASIGIALSEPGRTDVEEMLRNADLAMYHAKERGKNTFRFFDDSMNTDLVRYQMLVAELRRALERDEISLHYQPIVAAEDLQLVGVEALARWTHLREGPIPPGEFIRVAEEGGLMGTLGDWIIREACRQYAHWRDAALAPPRIAVNVSAVQLRGGSLAKTVVEAVREHALDPACLELEVTEGAMLVDEDEASRCLAEMKALGVRVALDDFGTGYSSLSYVKRFPVDSLKIDRSFVGDVETNPEARAITNAIIAMAHQLGLKVVGEGVESEAQETYLREQGCDELQGYRYARPMPADEMERMLRPPAPERRADTDAAADDD